jgi:hypothetical protein
VVRTRATRGARPPKTHHQARAGSVSIHAPLAGASPGSAPKFRVVRDSDSICEEHIISGLNAIVKKDGALGQRCDRLSFSGC